MFHATKLLGQDERFFLTEPCRSPVPTSPQRILLHGFSYNSAFIPNQVRTAMIRCIPTTLALIFFSLRVALLRVALAGLYCLRSELSPTIGRRGSRSDRS